MAKHAINEFDLFYISYDEPQKEEFWAKLQDQCPWAQRIDGVKGFDSAHKACANASTTDRFITVDGDNLVHPEFFDLELDIPQHLATKTLSWGARNNINGLNYGNGGLKLWTKEFVLGMRTHENATKKEEAVDFCWDANYVQLNNTYSDTCPNGSPFQAFRAGFREGIKMTLDRGAQLQTGKIENKIYATNFKRLLIWASIGADVENGLWSIYGARLGVYMGNVDAIFNIANISDYDWFKNYFYTEIAPQFDGLDERCPRTGQIWSRSKLKAASSLLLTPLYKDLGMKIADLDESQSMFFKEVYEQSKRLGNPLITETEGKGA